MLPTRKRKSGLPKHRQIQADLSAEEIEALRLQINQIQAQVDILTATMAQLNTGSFRVLSALGGILYFLVLPLLWAKRAFVLLYRWVRRAWMLLKDPQTYWTAFYWLSFARVLILDGGLKGVLISLRHPRRLDKSIDLLQQ